MLTEMISLGNAESARDSYGRKFPGRGVEIKRDSNTPHDSDAYVLQVTLGVDDVGNLPLRHDRYDVSYLSSEE